MSLEFVHYSVVFGKAMQPQPINLAFVPSSIVQSKEFYDEVVIPLSQQLKKVTIQSNISQFFSTYNLSNGLYIQGDIQKIIIGINKSLQPLTEKLLSETAVKIENFLVKKITDLNEVGINFQIQKNISSPEKKIKNYFKTNISPFNRADCRNAAVALIFDLSDRFKATFKIEADVDNELIDISANYSKNFPPTLDKSNKPNIEEKFKEFKDSFEQIASDLLK